MSERILAALRAGRQSWVALPAGGEVRIIRPPEADFGTLSRGVTVDHVCKYVDGWRNVTEATLLGADLGADDPVEFSADVWSTWVRDNTRAISTVAEALAAAVARHIEARQAASGN